MLVFNTCTIREKADERFHARLMDARAAKLRDPSKVIVVGGCWSESVKDELFELYPFVDLAYGPGNISRLGEFIQAGGDVPRGHFSTFDEFSGDLPMRRERPFQAWLQISQGCNSTCSYCIVPSVRGREQSRPAAALRGRGRALRGRGRARADAARPERQLLGSRPARGRARGFGELLRLLDAVPGIERIRYTSPHPKDMRDDVDRRPPRVRVGLRARASAAAVGLDAHPQGDAAHVLARALRGARARAARGRAGPGADDRRHRRLPGRERGRLRGDARGLRGGLVRPRVHVHLLAAAGDGRGAHGRAGRRGRQARAPRAARRGHPAARPRAQPGARSARSRRCSSRARRAPTPRSCAAARAPTRRCCWATPSPASSCAVRIEAATSQTLRGVARARARRLSERDGRRHLRRDGVGQVGARARAGAARAAARS